MILNAVTLAILSQSVQARFSAGLERTSTPTDFLSMVIPSTTGANIYPFLKDLGAIREWVGDRVIQNLDQGNFTITNKDYEFTRGLPRNAIDDDSYGIYGPDFEQAGSNVKAFPADKQYELLKAGHTTLCPDGQYFFDTDHPVGSGVVSNSLSGAGAAWYVVDASKVYKPIIWQPRKSFDLVKLFNPDDPNVFFQKQLIWGVDGRAGVGFSPFWQLAFRSQATLDAAGLDAVVTAMSSQKNDAGKPLKIMGTHLVVPPSLRSAGQALVEAKTLASGADNTNYGLLKLVVAPELA